MGDDQRLLREYAADGSRDALEELIRRHLALVYSSALRQVRDSHLAEDVTQAVFLVLTQRAWMIRSGEAVGGWLLAVTRCAAVNAMKKQTMHKKHESLAARPETTQAAADQWEHVAEVLDGELNHLGRVERDAVVLRFFQDRSFAEIGRELGLSEEAARKRVARGLERLRGRLNGRKISISAGALSATIGIYAVQAAPRHLLAGTLAASIAAPTPQCLLLAKGAIHMIAWTKAKLIGAVAACVLAGGAGVVVVAHAMADQPAGGQAVVVAAPAAAAVPQSAASGPTPAVPDNKEAAVSAVTGLAQPDEPMPVNAPPQAGAAGVPVIVPQAGAGAVQVVVPLAPVAGGSVIVGTGEATAAGGNAAGAAVVPAAGWGTVALPAATTANEEGPAAQPAAQNMPVPQR